MHGSRRRVWMMAVLAAAACAPLAAQSPAPAFPAEEWRRLVGCYRVGSRFIALDSMPGSNPFQPEGGLQAWAYWHEGRRAHWRPLGGDSVEVGGGDSLHGWRFRGVVRGRDLEGVTTPWTDIAHARISPLPWVFVREPCGTDGVTDGPPPNAQMLLDSFPVRMAEVVADSLLPRLGGTSPLGVRYEDNPYSLSAEVGRALVRRAGVPQPAPDASPATWVYLEGFTTERDSAAAYLVTLACPEARGSRSAASRQRVRLRRDGSGWVLAGIDAAERVPVRCRQALRDTWLVRLLW